MLLFCCSLKCSCTDLITGQPHLVFWKKKNDSMCSSTILVNVLMHIKKQNIWACQSLDSDFHDIKNHPTGIEAHNSI